jgi:hypothetical protein
VKSLNAVAQVTRFFCLLVVALSFPSGSWAAGPPSGLDVTVTNTTTNPVPVTGSVGVSGGVTVNNTANAPVPVINVNPAAASLFIVPFFIEQDSGPPVKGSLVANFTLSSPAILESISLTCGGKALGALLEVDGGPLGVNGVTGAGSAGAGVVVGLFGGQQTPISLPVVFPNGPGGLGMNLPMTHIGAPVKSAFTFFLFQDTSGTGADCLGSFIFRAV